MNVPRQIFKNTVALSIADLVTRAGSMVLAFIISRVLHVSGLGIYSTAMAYYSLLSVASVMGAKDFLVREIAKEPSRTNQYVIHAGMIGTVASVAIMVIFWLVLPLLGYSAELAQAMLVTVIAIVPGTLTIVQDAVFVAHQRVEFVMYTRFVITCLNVGLGVYLLTHGYGVVNLLAVFVALEYLMMACLFIFINRYITRLHWEFKFSIVKNLIWEMKTFTALSLLAALISQPEIIILSLTQDEAKVGYFSAATKLVGFWYFISHIYMTNVYPVLSRSYYHADQKFQIIQDKSIKYLLAISLPLTAGTIAAAGPILHLFYGPGFEESILPLQILAWSIMPAFVNAVLWRVLAARNQQASVLWTQIVTLFTRLGGGYLLMVWLATIGAAISVPANMMLSTLIFAYFIQRSGCKVHLLRLSWRFALAALGMGVLAWFLSQSLSLWVIIPISALIYAGLALMLKAFSQDDIALFRQIWRPGIVTKC
ncbi:MAG: flippase [Anaerolineales bacterium]|nr:flippase [Anaerolineales bacterium]